MKRKNTAAGELAITNEKLMSSRLQPQHNCTESEIRSSIANQMETIVEASGEKRTESRAVVKDKWVEVQKLSCSWFFSSLQIVTLLT
jgi:hypothetical protein